MNQQTFATSLTPEVLVEKVGGNLEVRGWDRSQVEVHAAPSEAAVEQDGDALTINCDGNCTIRMPHRTSFKSETAHGNLNIRAVETALAIDVVHGALSIRDVASTQIDNVYGDMNAKNIAGDLTASRVMGNAVIRKVQGNCYLDEVSGNLDLRDATGEVKTQVAGNARLRLSVMEGQDYEIQAEGEVYCHVPEGVGLHLKLSSDSEMIKVRLNGESRGYTDPTFEKVIGDGQISLAISAGGAIYLYSQRPQEGDGETLDGESFGAPPDFSDEIARQIEEQIEAQMEEMTSRINEQMTRLNERIGLAGLSPEETERIMQQAARTSERETARAQEKMRRAQEKMERKLEAARRRAEQRAQNLDRRSRPRDGFGLNFQFPSAPSRPSGPPPPPVAPVSDEERLMILRMLEQKKITLDDAEKLLAALEERG